MSILVDKDTRLLVQGITGREGGFHAGQMLAYGTNVVGGVTPKKGGQTALDGAVPVFDTCAQAVESTGANASVIFVPAFAAPDAIMEAVDAGIETIFAITEHIPALDMIPVVHEVAARGARLVGPNCPGATTPAPSRPHCVSPPPTATGVPASSPSSAAAASPSSPRRLPAARSSGKIARGSSSRSIQSHAHAGRSSWNSSVSLACEGS